MKLSEVYNVAHFQCGINLIGAVLHEEVCVSFIQIPGVQCSPKVIWNMLTVILLELYPGGSQELLRNVAPDETARAGEVAS